MPRTLLSKLPGDFKTLPLLVEAGSDGLCYQSLGQPLNFSQMLARRRPVAIDDPHRFSVELANLGVSVRLTLHWQGRDHWVLVRQQRPDRQDDVLSSFPVMCLRTNWACRCSPLSRRSPKNA